MPARTIKHRLAFNKENFMNFRVGQFERAFMAIEIVMSEINKGLSHH